MLSSVEFKDACQILVLLLGNNIERCDIWKVFVEAGEVLEFKTIIVQTDLLGVDSVLGCEVAVAAVDWFGQRWLVVEVGSLVQQKPVETWVLGVLLHLLHFVKLTVHYSFLHVQSDRRLRVLGRCFYLFAHVVHIHFVLNFSQLLLQTLHLLHQIKTIFHRRALYFV